MNKKTFTKEEIYDIVDSDEAIHVSSKPAKHGCVLETYVIKQGESFWKFSFERSENEGWQIDDTVRAIEVMPKEETVIEWIVKE